MLESLTCLHLITANQLCFYEAISPKRFSLFLQVLTAKLTPDVSTGETSCSFFCDFQAVRKKSFNGDEERKKKKITSSTCDKQLPFAMAVAVAISRAGVLGVPGHAAPH